MSKSKKNKNSKKNKKEDDIVENAILKLEEYKKNKAFNPTINLPFMDMILNRNKRNSIYTKYDKKYKSTSEEDKIFREMTKRRKGDNE